MLDKHVFKQGFERLLHFFPGWDVRHDNPETMKAWYEFFKNMDNEDFEVTINSYIENEVYLPTVAGISRHKPFARTGVPTSKSVLGPREEG